MARKPAFIRHSPQREAEIQSRLLNVLEARFRRRIAAVLEAETDRLVGQYRDLGFVPMPSNDDFRAVRDMYLEIAKVSARTFGSRILSQGKALGHDIETKQIDFAQFFLSMANRWINQEPIRRRITSVTETTRERIVTQVSRGQEDGLSIEQIARLVLDNSRDVSRTRAAMIARTETHGAANFAAHQAASATGLELMKEWVSVEDHRTRRPLNGAEFNHAAMNGQTVPMDEPFKMPWTGGEPINVMYPGEAGLPGGAVINCRCAVAHVVVD